MQTERSGIVSTQRSLPCKVPSNDAAVRLARERLPQRLHHRHPLSDRPESDCGRREETLGGDQGRQGALSVCEGEDEDSKEALTELPELTCAI
jgi:hypothetical protein